MRRAERVRDAFGLVLVLVLVTYVLGSVLGNHGWSAVVLCLATSATSVVALTSAHSPARLIRAAIWLSGLTVGLAVVAAVSGADVWLNLASLVQVCLLAAAMLAVLDPRPHHPRSQPCGRSSGRSASTPSSGCIFSFVYDGDRPAAEPRRSSKTTPIAHHGDFLFFSYTTLTTTGYGNLVPAGQPGKMIAGLEMMFGQIFLVTMVAGLVSLWRPGAALLRRRAQRAGGEPGGSGVGPPASGPAGGAEPAAD